MGYDYTYSMLLRVRVNYQCLGTLFREAFKPNANRGQTIVFMASVFKVIYPIDQTTNRVLHVE